MCFRWRTWPAVPLFSGLHLWQDSISPLLPPMKEVASSEPRLSGLSVVRLVHLRVDSMMARLRVVGSFEVCS